MYTLNYYAKSNQNFLAGVYKITLPIRNSPKLLVSKKPFYG
jgi:hypothetical protein